MILWPFGRKPPSQAHAETPSDQTTPHEPPAPKRRLRDSLTRSCHAIAQRLAGILRSDAATTHTALLSEIENLLIEADFGISNAEKIARDIINHACSQEKSPSHETILRLLAHSIETTLSPFAKPLDIATLHKPHILLMVGVNGTGKTTTIGKLAALLRRQGRSVLIVAADHFRAAAVEQLRIWAERAQATLLAPDRDSNAASLVFRAMETASRDAFDVVLIDTAGRMHNKNDLMDELRKIIRVIRKHDPVAPHDTILVLDATTGQHALDQAKAFQDIADVSGFIMAKLDGTARGGILLSVATQCHLPVHAIGIGEGIDDLQTFSPHDFARAITGINLLDTHSGSPETPPPSDATASPRISDSR